MAALYDSDDDDIVFKQPEGDDGGLQPNIDDGFQDASYFSVPEIACLVDSMTNMFPSVPMVRVEQIVHQYGVSNQEMIIDELLRASDDAEADGAASSATPVQVAFSAIPVEVAFSAMPVQPAFPQNPVEVVSSENFDESPSSSGSSVQSSPSLQPPRKQPKLFDYRDFTTPDERLIMRCEMFRNFLPDADPDFLKDKAREYGEDEARIWQWLEDAMANQNYPTLVEYLKRKECKDAMQLYTEMCAEDFLEIFPEGESPATYFSRRDRSSPSEVYRANTATFLKIIFPDADEALMAQTLTNVKGLLLPAVNCLEAAGCARAEMPSCGAFETGGALDLTFIQEMTFLRLQDQIEDLLLARQVERKHAKAAARQAGTLFECPICGDDDILVSDVLECNGGRHLFCVQCVKRQAEMAASEARSAVPCLQQCSGFFTLSQLRGVIGPSLFNTLLKAVQQHELKEAALDGLLVACPFCGFSCEIEDQRMDVFKCLNPVCRIDSCRKCKKAAHGSVPCDKVESDSQTKARLHLEEKLTSAIVRHCPRCKKEVVKEEGCNLMACNCGVKFCYSCRQEIPGYNHFNNGNCQQWIVSEEIHRRDLSRAVKEGKAEVQNQFGSLKLVHDPTADVEVDDNV